MGLLAFFITVIPAFGAEDDQSFWRDRFQQQEAKAVLGAAVPLESQKDDLVALLFREGVYEFLPDGNLITTQTMVYKVQTAEGARNWSHVQVSWSPWHEEKPEVSVRVTNPDGQQHRLTTQDLMEVSGQADSGNIYSDAKILKGPIPQVKEGSVVEQKIVYRTSPTLPGGGILRFWSMAGNLPEAHNALKIITPKGTSLTTQVVGQTDVPSSVTEDGKGNKVQTWFKKNIPAFRFQEDNLPTTEILWPGVYLSTAPDWKVLGKLYSSKVEELLKTHPLKAPEGVVSQVGTPREKVIRYLHWIDGRVRYTGLELGVNAIVPVSPNTVLDRGFGDCKDKALLLVSLLRQSGVEVDLTLIKTGPGQDVYAGVPGLDHFNHAIVRVGGAEPFFVDPTVEYNRQGLLPYWDQNRLVLVASPKGGEALRTPVTTSQANQVTERREVQLGDSGEVAWAEDTITYTGDYEIFYRNRYAGETPEQRKKRQENYASGYLRGTQDKVVQMDTGDLSAPFSYTIRVNKSSLGYTSDTTATWEFDWGNLKGWIPDAFLEKQDQERTRPFQYNLPFRVTWEQIIRPPLGFQLRGLPEFPNLPLGTFSLSSRGSTADDGSYRLQITLDSGPSLVSTADFKNTRIQLENFFAAVKPVRVIFDHEAGTQIQAGNYKGAFETYRRLAQAEPKKAIHHIRLSSALLRVGLGDEALKHAEEAVKLEPKNDQAWSTLAWTLEFNPLGRRFGKGFDRERSSQAFRKAMVLNPDAWYHRANLAILLEVDENGLRFGSEAALKEARIEYEALGKDIENGELESNYLSILYLLGDYKALKEKALGSRNRELKNLYSFLALAGLEGIQGALAGIDPQLDQSGKSDLLIKGAEKLIRNRLYNLAAATFREAAKTRRDGVDLEYRADNLQNTRAITFDPKPGLSPEETVRQYLVGLVLGDGKVFDHLKPLVTPEVFQYGQTPAEGTVPFYRDWSALNRSAQNQDVPGSVLMDMWLAASDWDLRDGGAAGMYVGRRNKDEGDWQGFYLQKNDGRWVIAALPETPHLIGQVALKALSAGQTDVAGTWLDWHWEDTADRGSSSVYENPRSRLWRSGDPRDPGSLTLAAKALTLDDPQALEAALSGSTGDKAVALGLILSEAWGRTGEKAKSAWVLEPLVANRPREEILLSRYYEALRSSGQRERAQTQVKALLEQYPRDAGVQRQALFLYVTSLNHDGLQELLKKYNPRLEGGDYNNMAWMALFQDKVTEQALEWGRKAVTLTQSRSRASLHTLATLYAETGRLEEARKILDQSMSLGYDADPESEDWYVLGLVAEGYGFPDAARQAYGRVKPVEGTADLAETYYLAKRRLERMAP